LQKANLWKADQQLYFPVITKSGVNRLGKTIRYYFNYSNTAKQIQYSNKNGIELFSNKSISANSMLELEAWGVKIIEEE
jgi:beta-galactosidase